MSGAHVGSFDAVRDFRAALVVFLHEAREAISSHDLEVRRSLEWLLESQPQLWRQEIRRCEDEITRAKIELERCRHSKLPGGGTPSCIEERKALERTRQRRLVAEQKIESVRKWGHLVEREAAEYAARANQLTSLLDVEVVRAIAMLDRTLTVLAAYTATGGQPVMATEPPAEAETPREN